MSVEILKSQILNLVDEINESIGIKKIAFNQQAKKKENMSLTGANGRLWIQPTTDGYDVSLSGKSLENEMTPFLTKLFNRREDGYKQSNASQGKLDQPYWRTSDFGLVRQTAIRYAQSCN